MIDSHASSRRRFESYRADVSKRSSDGGPPPGQPAHPRGRPRITPRLRSTGQLLGQFWGLTRNYRGELAIALLTLTVSTGLALIPPAATKFIVDYVLGDLSLADTAAPQWLADLDRWGLLQAAVAGVLAISVAKVVLHVWGRWYATRTTKRIQLSVRKRVFEHAVRLPLQRVHDLKSGGLASLLREDAGSIGDLVFALLYNPWRALVQLLGSLAILAWVDWRLLLGALAILPFIYLTHRTWIREIRPRYRDVRARREEIDGLSTETFSGMRVVRAFSRQRTETARIMTNNHLMARQELYVWWWMRTIEIVWELIIPFGSGLLLLYGGWQVLEGTLTVGDLMMFLVYLLMLLEPLAIIAQSAATLQTSLSGLDRVLDLLDEPREMESSIPATRVERGDVRGEVAVERVSFRYSDEGNLALDDVNLHVDAGQTVALVGPSGAGKTTLCNLIARFYDPTDGRVRLDGRDLREIDVESYRNLLGVVDQEVFLFDGTVSENIAYANRDAADEAIRHAARVANAHGFITELPHGYDTIIGERGVKLSGGQRQRLAIARAVLADPRILILDEATSNLDTESERLIQQSLERLMQNRTSFVIAHRLSTIRNADLIVVLEGGRIVEQGTHEELMLKDTRYREMVRMQTAPPEDVATADLLEKN
ncbi:Putative multidrug export ATP-binding/permease protein [Maioricimonas rarisocia]|uniref:Multidrug export ATP-binding/permease protein n=1 Tax=Maioricimonas rarisocia TaxID=2528026 RepID=A0A517Z329_9PLAN|nr:ABC transporter ATP-binding protein [Maioricimonas rarisocia]QDU36827.1 Putative multidrug export ATP-binding/permease protein [Maioricimonas rarisocia]